ncbi:MAG: MFS transporter [Comamonadaceae bacterium]|nr:MAG: MFS transporter [Comamonadaceae bacterium]
MNAHPAPQTARPADATDALNAAPAAHATPLFDASPRAAWLAVASMAVGTFATVTTEFMPIGLLTDIAADLNVTKGAAGLMITVSAIAAAIAGPALVVMSGRLDRRKVMVALSSLLIASNVLAALAPNLTVMLVARFLLGLCVGGFWTFAPGATAQLVPAAKQARAISLVLAGVSLATVLGVPAGAFAGSHAGWRAAFAGTAVLSVAVLAVQMWLLPSMPPSRAIKPRDLLAPFRSRLAVVGLTLVLFLIAGHFAAYTYLKPLLEQVFGLSPDAVTTLLLVYGAAGFIGTFAGGLLVEKSVRWTAMLAAAMIAFVLLVTAVAGSGFGLGIALIAIWGIAFGLVPVSLTSWMMKAVPDAPEAGQALLVTGFQVAIASGALLGGFAVDSYGVPSAAWLGGGLALFAVGIIAVFGGAGTAVTSRREVGGVAGMAGCEVVK